MTDEPIRRQLCAGGIVVDDAGRLLLVKRGRPPGEGLWSVPGGRCRHGESSAAACVREVAEETGIRVQVLRLAGRVQRAGDAGTVYDIDDFVCVITGGVLQPGDDADDARWVTGAELRALPVVAELIETLSAWGCLPS